MLIVQIKKVFRSQVFLTSDGIWFANIWQKVTSYLQQPVSLMSISNVCKYRVEFGAGRQSCDNGCQTHSNMATIRTTQVTHYQHHRLLSSQSGVIVNLIAQPIDDYVEEMTQLVPTFVRVERTLKTMRTVLSTMTLRTVKINSKWHIL